MKTLLTLEIDYGPMTDPEGLAAAMDQLMKTACSTPGILDDYGHLVIGEFLVDTPPNIDGPTFRKQRQLLLKLRDLAAGRIPNVPDPGDRELLEGLIELTDELADQAHDKHGVDCLLDTVEEPGVPQRELGHGPP